MSHRKKHTADGRSRRSKWAVLMPRVQVWLGETGGTYADLAEACECSPGSVSKWFGGDVAPSWEAMTVMEGMI